MWSAEMPVQVVSWQASHRRVSRRLGRRGTDVDTGASPQVQRGFVQNYALRASCPLKDTLASEGLNPPHLLRWVDADAPPRQAQQRYEPPIVGLSATPFRSDAAAAPVDGRVIDQAAQSGDAKYVRCIARI